MVEIKEDNIRKPARYKLLIMSFMLLFIIMSFTGLVNYIAFANNYNNSLVNTYSVAGKEFVRKIEYALSYGKPIDNYYGMNDTLNELKDVIEEIEQVEIVSTTGNVLYNLKGFVRSSRLPDELIKAAVFQQGVVNEHVSYQFYNKKAYIFIKINDSTSQHVASLEMVLPEDRFLQFNSHYTKQLAAYLAGIAMMALILLSIIFSKTNLFSNDILIINKKKILVVMIAVLGSAQLLYSSINYFLFKDAYMDMAYTSKEFIQNVLEKNIDGVYSRGLSLQNIKGLDAYLDLTKDSLPQIQDIRLEGPLNKINATISNDYIGQQMFQILLDMLTVLVISIFFMIELTLMAVMLMSINQRNTAKFQEFASDTRTSHGLVRALTFLVNIGVYMSLTFVPIVMKNVYTPILGLPKDVVLGLPLSAEMLGGILAIILAGWSINKQGWRIVFYTGAMFLALGNLLSGLSDNALLFIFFRAIAGFGLGYIMMALRSLVVSLPESNAAIAEFSAGSIAGLNCGAVIGGMLADRVGYEAIFFLAAITVVVPLIFVRKLMTQFEIVEREISASPAFAKFYNFIADKKAMLFLGCIFIPYFISGAFLDYYFPLFASSNDLSQSDISRGFLLNGLFIIYLGPILTRYVTNKLGDISGMIVSMFIVIGGLAIFMLFGTIAAAFVAVVLLGIAESFGVSVKTTYFLNLKGIRDLEINKGIAYFSAMVNLSRMAGPIIFGAALSFGMRIGVGLVTFVIFMLLVVFIFSTKFGTENKNTSATG